MTITPPPAKRQTAGAGAFSIKVVIALLFVGIFSFSSFMVLSAFAPEWARGDDGREHALSKSAVGFAGIVELLNAKGEPATVSRSRRVADTAALVVFTPERPVSPDELSERAYMDALVILPKWATTWHKTHPGWVTKIDVYGSNEIASIVAAIAPKTIITQASGTAAPRVTIKPDLEPNKPIVLDAGPISHLQTMTGEALTPIVTTADGGIILARAPETDDGAIIYILSDPDFLNTQGIANVNTARAGVAMLDALRAPKSAIAFDVTMNGFERDRSIMRMAFTPPFLAATLSLAAAALLLAWRAITQTRPAVHEIRAIALGKRALTENSAALIRMANREHKMGWGYAQLVAAQIAERIGARGDAAQTVASLDRLGESRGLTLTYSDLAAEASAAENTSQVLDAARRLYAWREDAIRATD